MLNDTKILGRTKGFVAIFVVFAVLFVGVAAGTFYFLKRKGQIMEKPATPGIQNSPSVKTSTPTPAATTTATPTPFAFQEITIPYLRNREYQSSLGQLESVSENANYTSYLASYDSDGFKVYGHLTVPKGPELFESELEGSSLRVERPVEGWPAVVFVHGYIPPRNYKTLVNYATYVDYLAKNGLVVFKIDLRGHAESEGEAFGAYYSGDYIVDILNAYSALQIAEFVDPERVGLWGHSMAGNVVFRSFAAMPEIPKVVIWAGAIYTYEDFSAYSISDSSYRPPPQQSERRKRREKLFNTYGPFDSESDFWKQVPATNYLDGLVGSIQIHHAANDSVVDIGYSQNLMSILDNTKIDHELFEYASGGHNLTGSSFTQAMQRSVELFSR